MRKLFMLAPLALAVACASGEEEGKKEEGKKGAEKEEVAKSEPVTYNVAEGSTVTFVGNKTEEEGSHDGTLPVSEGSFTVDNGVVTSGTFTIDMAGMKANSGYGEEKDQALTGHLSDSTFFDVNNHSTANFTVGKHEGDMIEGELTLMGETFPVELSGVTITENEGGATATASGTLELGEMAPPAFAEFKLSPSIPVEISLNATK